MVNLHPAAVVIAGGVNDISRNTGPVTAGMIGDNIRAMCEIAKATASRSFSASSFPSATTRSTKQTINHPPADIAKFNDWLRRYAAEIHAEVADYYSVIVDNKGMLKEGYSEDGAHANDRSYALMAPVAEAAIERALEVAAELGMQRPGFNAARGCP